MARKRALEIRFTPAARADLVGIWHWNAAEYGESRADRYVEFLLNTIERLGAEPLMGAEVSEYPGLRRFLAKRRAKGHGHIVFYRIVEERLEVIHLFHTAQDWRNRLELESEHGQP